MLEVLSERMQQVFKTLRGEGHLTERHVDAALAEIRRALLGADVALPVVKDFVARVRERAVGQQVLSSLTPAQQVIKVVHEELTRLLGGEQKPLRLKGFPSPVMLVGLQGTGKTTTCAKLGVFISSKLGKHVLLVPADTARPAAREQLGERGLRLGAPRRQRERQAGEHQHAQGPRGAVARLAAGSFQPSPGGLDGGGSAEAQRYGVGHEKSQQQATGAHRHVLLQPQPSHTKMGLEIAKRLLHLHALPVQRHHSLGGQHPSTVRRNQQKPRLLERRVLVDHHVHPHLCLRLVEHPPVPTDTPAQAGQLPQLQPPPLPRHARACAPTNHKQPPHRLGMPQQGRPRQTAVRHKHRPHPRRQRRLHVRKKELLQLVLTRHRGLAPGVREGVHRQRQHPPGKRHPSHQRLHPTHRRLIAHHRPQPPPPPPKHHARQTSAHRLRIQPPLPQKTVPPLLPRVRRPHRRQTPRQRQQRQPPLPAPTPPHQLHKTRRQHHQVLLHAPPQPTKTLHHPEQRPPTSPSSPRASLAPSIPQSLQHPHPHLHHHRLQLPPMQKRRPHLRHQLIRNVQPRPLPPTPHVQHVARMLLPRSTGVAVLPNARAAPQTQRPQRHRPQLPYLRQKPRPHLRQHVPLVLHTAYVP
jgi:hypothetical protein